MDSKRIDALSEQAENFYSRLRLVVDDYGRFEDDAVILLSKTFPRRVTRYTTQQVEAWMEECSAGEEPLIVRYRVGRKAYLQVQDFNQRIRKDKQTGLPTPSKYPPPPSGARESAAKIREEPRSAARASTTPASTHTHTATTPTATNAREGSCETPANLALVPTRLQTLFEAWWECWTKIRGSNHSIQASQAWISVVTEENAEAVFACTASYLASLENPAKGYNPENFLFEQARDGFHAKWPPKRAGPADERRSRDIEKFRRLMAADLAESA